MIDVSDLLPSMERVAIQKYSFADGDFEVLVLLDLPEPVSKEKVKYSLPTMFILPAFVLQCQKILRWTSAFPDQEKPDA